MLRREKGWGPQLLAGFLRTQGISVGSMIVYRILDREERAEPFPGETQGQTNVQALAYEAFEERTSSGSSTMRSMNTRSQEGSSPATATNSGAWEEESQASTPTVNSKGSNTY